MKVWFGHMMLASHSFDSGVNDPSSLMQVMRGSDLVSLFTLTVHRLISAPCTCSDTYIGKWVTPSVCC